MSQVLACFSLKVNPYTITTKNSFRVKRPFPCQLYIYGACCEIKRYSLTEETKEPSTSELSALLTARSGSDILLKV